MRIAHVNYDYGLTGGATIAAVRLHTALLSQSVDSLFVCRQKTGHGAAVIEHPPTVCGRTGLLAKRKACDVLQRLIVGRGFPVNWVHSLLPHFLKALSPDIVHLHWVKLDMLAIEEIPLIQCPVVWSLHDLWPCLGTNSYPELGELNAQHRASRRGQWVHEWTLRRKIRAFRRMPMCVVAASQWCVDEARRSQAFQGHRIECIPHCVDVACFAPGDAAAARQSLRLPGDKVVVAYGANMGTKWPIKGFDRLVAAVQLLPREAQQKLHIAVFGEDAPNRSIGECNVQFLGRLPCPEDMARVYQAADVFAFPSRQETFGQTKAEALACGIPVVAFAETACAEELSHGDNGWIAEPNDVPGFAAGLQWAIALAEAPERRLPIREQARRHALARFSPEFVASEWIKLYSSIQNESRSPAAMP